MKPTEGKWVRGVCKLPGSAQTIALHACVFLEESSLVLAITGPAGDGQSQADAGLMAAAPAMYSALAEALRYLVYSAEPSVADSNVKWEKYEAVVKQVRAAIREAKGEEAAA